MKRDRAAARRSSIARCLAQAVESLESRRLLSSTPVVVTQSTPFTQNWNNTGLINANNDWSAVPGIVGYSTSALTTPTVSANQANPLTFTTGGPAEFELADPTVALAGSGSATLPSLVLYLDTTQLTNVQVQYRLRDLEGYTGVDGAGDNAIQPITLAYRFGSTGNFTTISAAGVADATTGPGTNAQDTLVNVTVPSLAGHADLQLRISTVNAAGNDEWVGVDDISVGQPVIGPGSFSISSGSLSAPEGTSPFSITINRTNGSVGAATVDYALSPGTATSPADFNGPGGSLTGTLSFADGQTSATIPVTIVDDHLVDPNETFGLTLSNPTNGTKLSSPSTSTITIADNDFAGVFNFVPTSYTVNENVGNATLTIKRTGGTVGAVALSYATSDITASDGSDYFGTSSGFVNFADGVDTATINIPIINDSEADDLPVETFGVSLDIFSGDYATIGSAGTATVGINDDDTQGALSFSSSNYSVSEATGTVTLTVQRLGGTGGAVSANYATSAGTAGTSDFTSASGVVSFAAGQSTAQITIPITNDSTIEAAEYFTVSLSNPAGGATLGTPSSATVTITNDDTQLPTGLLINEVFIDPPSTNAPFQFVELKGTPSTVLSDVYLLVLNGDLGPNANPGTVSGVIDLSGAKIGSNGLLMVKAEFSGFNAASGATGVLEVPFFDGGDTNFVTSSMSVVLAYRDPTGTAIPTVGTDLDSDDATAANNAGTLDALPSNLTVLDGVGTSDGGTTDVIYGAALPLLASGGAADAIVRFNTNTTPLSASAFYYGILADNDGLGTGSRTLTFSANAAQRSSNFPSDGIVTPGGVNAGTATVTDTTPPTLVSSSFDPRVGMKIVLTFSESVGASVSAADFTLVNNTSGATIPSSSLVTSGSADGKTITISFSGVAGAPFAGGLPNGNYTLTANGAGITDTAGNAMTANATANFRFVNGDFNYDGTTNFSDLVTLAQHYNQTSGATFATGDANYDGTVGFADLVLLAQNYNQSIALLAMIAAPTPIAAATAATTTTKTVVAKQAPVEVAVTATKPAAKVSAPAKVVAPTPAKPAAKVVAKPAAKVAAKPAAKSAFSSGNKIA